MREGWTPNSPLSKYIYLYDIKDHLGNVRLVHDDSEQAKIYQGNYYSAFGVSILSLGDNMTPTQTVLSNDRLYNGKELQDGTNWLDYGARMYYPELGRWMAVDPLPDTGGQESWSTYQYVFNNPARNTDPDGRACCGEIGNFIMGFSHAFNEDVLPIPVNLVNSKGGASYSSGATWGHRAALVVGFLEVGSGLGGDAAAVASEVATVGASTPLAIPLVTASNGLILHGSQTMAKAADNLRSSSKSGKYTEPTLPNKEIINEKGVKVEHYYKSGDHSPAHLHVEGNGKSTKVRANGKPIKGQPELSKAQKVVIENNKSLIRSTSNKINQYLKYQKHLKEK